MGVVQPHPPVLLITAAFSRYPEALQWARETAEAAWGKIALASEPFDFRETKYYESSMGAGIFKQFFAFEQLMNPAALPECKLLSNEWEIQFKSANRHAETRPLNLDPGYITEAKLVLATTKDRDHRLYLDKGIYAEGTLYYYRGGWAKRSWTYPDYLREDYHAFFTQCRNYLRQARHRGE